MKTIFNDRNSFKRTFLLVGIICLVLYLIYIIYCLCSVYSFDSLLREKHTGKIVNCSLDICYLETESSVTIDVDTQLFENIFQILQSEQYTKPLASILGHSVSAYHIEVYPFYRILLQYEDQHRIEIVVNGSSLLIGSTTKSGLTVYEVLNDDALLKKLNALF